MRPRALPKLIAPFVVLITLFILQPGMHDKNKSTANYYKMLATTLPVPGNALVAARAAEELSYFTHWRTIYLPDNISSADNNFLAWCKQLHPQFMLVDNNFPLSGILSAHIVYNADNNILVDLRPFATKAH
jgi:hypothetical protein